MSSLEIQRQTCDSLAWVRSPGFKAERIVESLPGQTSCIRLARLIFEGHIWRPEDRKRSSLGKPLLFIG